MRYSEGHETHLEIAQLILHVITCPRRNRCALFTVCQAGVYCFTVTGCTQIDLSQQGKKHSSLSQELITGALLVMGSCLSRSAVLPYGTQIIERERERERESGGGGGGHVQISLMSCQFVLVFGKLFKGRRNFNNDKYRLTF